MDTRAAILTVLLALPACSNAGDGVPDPGDPNDRLSLKEKLKSGTQTWELQPEITRIDVTAQMGDESIRSRLVMLQGATSLRADRDGSVVIEDISLGVDDVVLYHELLPPEGLRLMNIQAHLDGDMETRTTWTGDNELRAETVGTLVVTWAIMNHEGQPAPLAAQPLEGIPFSLLVDRDSNGDVDVTLTGAVPGSFWTWADYIELSDLDFSLAGTTGSYDPETPADDIVQ
jgi:hypothetical protein